MLVPPRASLHPSNGGRYPRRHIVWCDRASIGDSKTATSVLSGLSGSRRKLYFLSEPSASRLKVVVVDRIAA